MTRTEKEMIASGYYAEATCSSKREAEDLADDIQRCGQGQSTWIRKSATGWTLWVETEEQHDKRGMASS